MSRHSVYCDVTVNVFVEAVPSGLMIVIGPVVALSGTTAVICPDESIVNRKASAPLKRTLDVPAK